MSMLENSVDLRSRLVSIRDQHIEHVRKEAPDTNEARMVWMLFTLKDLIAMQTELLIEIREAVSELSTRPKD
jgi:hypothetical protein